MSSVTWEVDEDGFPVGPFRSKAQIEAFRVAWETKYSKCHLCAGCGRVPGKKGASLTCPTCGGFGWPTLGWR